MQLEFVFDSPRETPAESSPSPEPPPAREAAAPLEPVERQRQTDALRRELARGVKRAVALTITDNRSSVLSFRRRPDGDVVTVRAHHMFLEAAPEVVEALAHWIAHPRSKKAAAAVDQYIRENRHRIGPGRPRKVTLKTKGTHHDLATLFDEVNQDQFSGGISARITWGAMPMTPGRRHSIRFGSYAEDADVIRIHPLLDQGFVPRYFVKSVVFHEMLHALLGTASRTPSGRRRLHPPEFRRLERAYPDHARAKAWENNPAHLKRLLKAQTSPLRKLFRKALGAK